MKQDEEGADRKQRQVHLVGQKAEQREESELQQPSAGASLESAKQRKSIHAGHHEICDHDRGSERGDLLQRVLAVDLRLRHEAPVPDELFEAAARRRIVFDDEDPLGSRAFDRVLNRGGVV